MDDSRREHYGCVAFLWNPEKQEVFLHLRDFKAKNNPGKWGLFGGLAAPGESPRDCIRRELQEELSFEIPEKLLHPLWDYYNEDLRTWRYVFFVSPPPDMSGLKLTEGTDCRWISLSTVLELDLVVQARKDIEHFIKVSAT